MALPSLPRKARLGRETRTDLLPEFAGLGVDRWSPARRALLLRKRGNPGDRTRRSTAGDGED
jgi:hypothetical protein